MQDIEPVLRLIGKSTALLLLSDSVLRVCLLVLRMAAPKRAGAPESNPDSDAASGSSGGCVILIAAHDEAGTIGPTVAALIEHLVEWPGSGLWVVADRCSDQTAIEASIAGAKVTERPNGSPDERVGKCAVI